MAHKTSKDWTFKLDDATGILKDITGDTNQHSVQGTLAMLEDSGGGDTESTFLPGLAGATIPANGWVNSTTEGIFAPLVGKRTSITKTFVAGNGVKYLTGEAWPENVQISGNVNQLMAWSTTLRLDGAMTRTSVSP
jgi:hypothetical protein